MTPGPFLQILLKKKKQVQALQWRGKERKKEKKGSQANLFFCVCLVLKDLPEGSLAFLLQTVCAWASLQKKGGFSRHVNMSLAAQTPFIQKAVTVSPTSQTVALMRTGAASPCGV